MTDITITTAQGGNNLAIDVARGTDVTLDVSIGNQITMVVDQGIQGSSGTSGYSGISGYSGYSGISGYSSYSGFSGISGFSGYSGKSGFSGISGFSGSGISGYSGSGISGYSGYSGFSGQSGASTSGYSGYSGTSGFSGFSGISGTQGISGQSGFSGISGFSGQVGQSGYSGYSGESGTSGFSGAVGSQGQSGFSGISGYSGAVGQSGFSGISGYSGAVGQSGISGFSGFSGAVGQSGISGFSGFSGYSGQQGANINIVGEVATPADLPPSANVNDAYIVTSDGNLYVWNGSTWFDAGQIVGPAGASGISGFSGYSGASGISGFSGFSGISGFSGEIGQSGLSGYSGFSGTVGASGASGYSGFSGFSGSGVSGYSGYSGAVGTSGFSGFSGYSGSGVSGYSGFSGINGTSGISGFSGANGASGISGYSGAVGTSGFSGYSGFSGAVGASGISGYSGFSGAVGASGLSGFSGISGYSGSGVSGYSGFSGSGISGFSGKSGFSGYSGSGISGYSGYSGSGISGFSGFSGYSGAAGSGGGGIAWQSVQTANFTATAGNAYPVDTTSASITVTLPASPSAGNVVTVLDYAGTSATNNIIVNPNGNKLQGTTFNALISVNRQAYNFVYVDATQGWLSYAQEYASATQALLAVEALVVAGGGGGGGSHGGAGGAGGLIYNATQAITLGTAYTVTVGAGGAGGDATPNSGTQGANSVFSTLTSIGGGYGAKPYPSATVGGNGGSGGGGGRGAAGGTATSGQGYAGGGSSGSAPNYGGGGGGGAGAVGADGTTTSGGNGGVGLSYSITRTSTYYAGGGGGGTYGGGTLGTGGLGGGGNGGAAGNGTANTGGGGGAGSDSPSVASGNGGSGIVVIAFPTSAGLYVYPITGSLTYTSSTSSRSGYTVYTFTGGTGTITFTTTNPNLDPYFSSVSLLTNSANLLTFADASTNNFPITNNGGVKPSLNTPVTGGGSQYFSGSSYLTVTGSNAVPTGSGNYTVEGWINLSSVSSAQILLAGTGSNAFFLRIGTSYGSAANGLNIGRNLVADCEYCSYTFATNTWYHVAVTRASGVVYFFVNGVQQTTLGSGTSGYSFASVSSNTVGNTYSAEWCYGYFSNLRVTNTAIYTSNFTPSTTPLTAVSGTSLLINATNQNTFDNATFYDQSANSFAISQSGSPVYSGLSPFGNAYPGSVYLDGSSYLSGASNSALSAGSGAFTYETWFYVNSFPLTATLMDTGNTYGGLQIGRRDTGTEWGVALAYVAWVLTSSTLPTTNQWNHMVVVRNGSNNMSLFLNGTRVATTSTPYTFAQNGFNIGISCQGNFSNTRYVVGTAFYDPTQTTITVPTTPLPVTTNTSLLLGCDTGAFYDLSNIGNPISQSGSPVVTTQVSPFSSVTESYYFDGSSYLPIPNSASLSFGTGNFTFEGWFYASSLSGSDSIVFSAGNSGFGCILRSNAIVTFQSFVAYNNTFSTTLSNNTWYYIAISRTGSTITCYLNGTSIGSASNSTNYAQSTVGAIGADETGGSKFNGYINNLRITKGVARYTATFTPPTAPFPTSA